MDFVQIQNYYEPIFQTRVSELAMQTQRIGTQQSTTSSLSSHRCQGNNRIAQTDGSSSSSLHIKHTLLRLGKINPHKRNKDNAKKPKNTGCPGLDVSLVPLPSLHTESLHLLTCISWCLSGCPSTAFAEEQQRFRLEVTSGSHLVQHFCSRRATYSCLPGTVSSQVLNIFEDETSQPL